MSCSCCAYKDKLPVLVVGGEAGSFLGEYQAGGVIVVLGLSSRRNSPVGYFCGTGMHGGKIYLRCHQPPADLPKQVLVKEADKEDLKQIEGYIDEFCETFGKDKETVMNHRFFVLTPDTKNPYKQLYTQN